MITHINKDRKQIQAIIYTYKKCKYEYKYNCNNKHKYKTVSIYIYNMYLHICNPRFQIPKKLTASRPMQVKARKKLKSSEHSGSLCCTAGFVRRLADKAFIMPGLGAFGFRGCRI